MCGIAGIIHTNNCKIDSEELDSFTDSLSHRGPDGRGTWIDSTRRIGLGHRRLAILDISSDGAQPMLSMDGRYVITYNGEIYNFIELRSSLKDKGYKFRSRSDTEIILAAYDAWGMEMLSRFNGMWAFAIYDKKNEEVFFARDRYGIKPLLYSLKDGSLYFASEQKAFRYLKKNLLTFDPVAQTRFLAISGFSLEGTSRTLFQDIKRLRPGYCAWFQMTSGEWKEKRWWNTLEHTYSIESDPKKQAEDFYNIFSDSVSLRLRSDVPVGSCLSGGFDSSAVVCTMIEVGKQARSPRSTSSFKETFVATFPGRSNDEEEYAREVISYTGLNGNFFPFDDQASMDILEECLYANDDPYISPGNPVWEIYKNVRRAGISVTMDGHGADELMGGYRTMENILFNIRPSCFVHPIKLLNAIKNYNKFLLPSWRPGTKWKFGLDILKAIYLNDPGISYLKRYANRLCNFRTKKNVNSLFNMDLVDEATQFDMTGSMDTLPDFWNGDNCALYTMFHSNTMPTILRNYDRLSMAHGVEVRMPFMDYRLVNFLFSLNGDRKISTQNTKQIAREAMVNRMPEKIRSAKYKIGFNAPMPEWIRDSSKMKSWIYDLIESEKCKQHQIIHQNQLRKMVDKNYESNNWTWDTTGQIWPALNMLWFEQKYLNVN